MKYMDRRNVHETMLRAFDAMTAAQLEPSYFAERMGVTTPCVTAWFRSGKMNAARKSTMALHLGGPYNRYFGNRLPTAPKLGKHDDAPLAELIREAATSLQCSAELLLEFAARIDDASEQDPC